MAGDLLNEDGEVRRTEDGRTCCVEPGFDSGRVREIRKRLADV